MELFLSRRKLSRLAEYQRQELINRELEIMDLNRGMIEALATAIEFRSGNPGTMSRGSAESRNIF